MTIAKSIDALYQKITMLIQDGHYEISDKLPTLTSLAKQEHVSPRTVKAVYDRLVRDNLAHKTGNRFIAGPESNHGKDIGEKRSIIIVGEKADSWQATCYALRTEEFGRMFVDQADIHNIRLVQAIAKQTLQPTETEVSIGIEATISLVKRFGKSCLGILIVGHKGELPDIEEWINCLLVLKKPVVWFDKNDEKISKQLFNPYFIRCCARECDVCKAAVDFLNEFGHKKVGFLQENENGWQEIRFQNLVSLGSQKKVEIIRCKPSIHDLFTTLDLTIANLQKLLSLDNQSLNEHFVAFERCKTQIEKSLDPNLPEFVKSNTQFDPLLQYLFGSTYHPDYMVEEFMRPLSLSASVIMHAYQTLIPAINENLTAFIAANDTIAKAHMIRFKELGINFPEHFSLLSFDNIFRHRFTPITSVNFGLRALGYKAFHAIINDIPIEREQDGTIASLPFVCDKGSVGLPRKGNKFF